MKSTPIRFREIGKSDPLGYAFGLAWFERKPRLLTRDEERRLIEALRCGVISPAEYAEWMEYVR